MGQIGAGLVAGTLGVLLCVNAASGNRAPATDDSVSCAWQSGFSAAPGFSLAAASGSVRTTGTGSGSCSGTLDGQTLGGSALGLRWSGSYGAQSTCALAAGKSTVDLEVIRDYTVFRLRGLYDWNAPALQAGASGSLGGGSSQMAFTLSGNQPCGAGVITGGSLSMTISASGDVRRLPNAAPRHSLKAGPETIHGHGPVDIDVAVSDPDGSADLRDVAVNLRDKHGRAIGSWSGSQLQRDGARSLALSVRGFKLSGPHPWRVELTGSDRAGHDFAESVALRRR